MMLSIDEIMIHAPSELWVGSQTALERSLEGWLESVTSQDARRGVVVATTIAETALPFVEKNDQADAKLQVGGPDARWGDCPLTPREQVACVRAWLRTGSAIRPEAADYTHQLHIWDEDLRPPDDDMTSWYVYFVEATNLLVMAALHDERGGPFGHWGRPRCAARSAVCSYKAMSSPGADRRAHLTALLVAIEKETAR